MTEYESETPNVEAASRATPPPTPSRAEARAETPSRDASYKNPLLAAFLSLFPGIGNIYNGLYMRGLAFFLICVSMIVITTREPIFGLGIAFFWIFNVVDAYRQATLINAGYAQDLGIDEPPRLGTGQAGALVGAIMLLIGAFALYDNYFGPIDLDWLIDLWPVFLMAIGAWLIFDTVRDKKQREESGGYD